MPDVEVHATGNVGETHFTLKAALELAIELRLSKRGVQDVIAECPKITRDAIAQQQNNKKKSPGKTL